MRTINNCDVFVTLAKPKRAGVRGKSVLILMCFVRNFQALSGRSV